MRQERNEDAASRRPRVGRLPVAKAATEKERSPRKREAPLRSDRAGGFYWRLIGSLSDELAKAPAAEQPSIDGKICATCKIGKLRADFSEHRLARDGLRKSCKFCVRAGHAPHGRELTGEQILADKVRRSKPSRRVANRCAVARWSREHPLAVRARKILRQALKAGRILIGKFCGVSGCDNTRRLEAHHHDYREPLRVLWLCSRHHRRLHASGRPLRLKPGIPRRYSHIPPELAK